MSHIISTSIELTDLGDLSPDEVARIGLEALLFCNPISVDVTMPNGKTETVDVQWPDYPRQAAAAWLAREVGDDAASLSDTPDDEGKK